MKILEVRDNFIKFESSKEIALTSFVQATGIEKKYIAQVIQKKRAGENNIVYAKILFLYDGELQPYDKTLPSIDSDLSEFDFSIINQSFANNNKICAGTFADKKSDVNLDIESFNKKTLISIDSPELLQKFVAGVSKQFNNSIIIDTLGSYEGKKYIAGIDFKLPLNTAALDFMYEDCLSDATSDSKSLIRDIFQDLADYSKTVPFVPFGTLKTIVDDMVNHSHIFKLLVLKNKLAKFDKLGYFAADIKEAENLNQILASKNPIIDLSKLDTTFQNRYLSVIFSSIEKINNKAQIFVLASNSLDKKSLKKILTGNLSTTFATHSRFKYINEIKPMFENFVIEPSFVNRDVFKTYAAFLNSMTKDSILIVGKNSNNIPLISIPKEIQEEEEIIEITEEESTLSQEELIELEEALEAVDPAIDAINKKSEDYIEKVSEEITTELPSSELTIFSDEDENDIVSAENNKTEDIEPELREEINTQENEILELEEDLDNNQDLDIQENESLIQENIENPYENLEKDLSKEDEVITSDTVQSFDEFHTQVDEIQTIEVSEEISNMTEEAELEMETEENLVNNTIENNELQEEISSSEEIEEQEISIMPLESNDEENNDFGMIVELEEDIDDNTEDTIVIDFADEEPLDEALEKEIIEDVDKVFTTIKEESISDSDLDFIDELNNSVYNNDSEEIVLTEGMEELSELQELENSDEDSFLEPLQELEEYSQNKKDDDNEKEILETRNTSTPIVPVYEAEIPEEDLVISDTIEQGDTVVHAKYGNGVVEKMIKYGTKNLYSINFDNVGRRLLDPTLTEIKKA